MYGRNAHRMGCRKIEVGIVIGVCGRLHPRRRSRWPRRCSAYTAGYGFASTIDPTTRGRFRRPGGLRAIGGGLLFFALGLDREVMRLFALQPDKRIRRAPM